MSLAVEILISALLIVSGIFGLVGSYGLVKLGDTMQRLHAPTKSATLGVGGILVASMLYFAFYLDKISAHELLITVFLMMTAPITATFVAKSYMHRSLREDELPPTGGECGWSVYDEAPEEKRPIDTK